MEALRALGHRVRVLAGAPGDMASPVPMRTIGAGGPHAAAAAAALAMRRPRPCARDIRGRLAWSRAGAGATLRHLAPLARELAVAEPPPHLHVHFAAGAALDALRLARLSGVRYSLTAHAYDIFQHPRNLAAKLHEAAFVTTGCYYNVRELASLTGGAVAAERIVMGVDADRFRRRSPHRHGRTVVAVGRLVEKKGFATLVRALAAPGGERIERATIVGDGPLRGELAALAAELGVADRLLLAGALDHGEVRAAIEAADVLAAPCVIAADGDRDSMPVVVKEAMALELPVVASDLVGLPEIVREPWGRLVAAGDPAALAAALAAVLELPRDERAAAGAAGRAWVVEHADVRTETQRLSQLIEALP